MILYSKQRKLKKGTGFNLDLLIGGWFLKRNLSASLAKLSPNFAPSNL